MIEAKFYIKTDYIITVIPVSTGRAVRVTCTGRPSFTVPRPFFINHGLRQGLFDSDYAKACLRAWLVFVNRLHPDAATTQVGKIMDVIDRA